MTMVNREPETSTKDFIARMKFGVLATVVVFLVLLGDIYWVQWSESRFYRDVMGQVPFRDVIITNIELTETVMRVSGTVVKTRDCQTVGEPIVYVLDEGVEIPAALALEELPGTPLSRPVSPYPQHFGVWIITSPIPSPDFARMYRTHLCDGDFQTNLVFERKWSLP